MRLKVGVLAVCVLMVASFGLAHAKSRTVHWASVYEFSEFAPPHETWVYTLTLQEGSTATLNVDGFQTMYRYKCNVHRVGTNGIEIRFAAAGAGNLGRVYAVNQVLFTLVNVGGQVETHWNAMQPMLNASANNPVAFVAK